MEDLYHLQESYGDEFGQRLFQAYGIDRNNFHNQFQFRRLTDILRDLLNAVTDNRHRKTERGFRELRDFLNQPPPVN